jgi:hypothetical protein
VQGFSPAILKSKRMPYDVTLFSSSKIECRIRYDKFRLTFILVDNFFLHARTARARHFGMGQRPKHASLNNEASQNANEKADGIFCEVIHERHPFCVYQ